MAKKKEKQLTPKQQIQQQIVNYQVRQATQGNQQQNMQALQAEYDKWNAIQNLQSEYDTWLQGQQPKQAKSAAPKVEPVKFATAEERKAMKEAQTQKLAVPFDPEKSYAKTYGNRGLENAANNIGGSVNQIPGLDSYVQALARQKEEKNNALEQIAKADDKKSYKDIYTEQSLKKNAQDEEVRRAREKANTQRIADTMLDVTGANQQNNTALAMLNYQPRQIEKAEAAIDNRTDAEKMAQWLDPNYKLSKDELADAREVAQRQLATFDMRSGGVPVLNSDEDRQKYADAVNLLNKTSGFTNAMTGALNPFLRVAKNVRNSLNVMGNQLQEGAANVTDALGITNNAREAAQESIAQRQRTNDSIDASNQAAIENARKQNPILTTAGEFGGMIGMYGLTNPVFDGAAAALGATSGLGRFAANQVGQNAQDLVLDTIPMLKDYMADGSLSDEEKAELAKNVGFNVAGNLVPGLIGEGLSRFKNARNAVENIAPDVDNVVRNATRQAEEAAQNIDNLANQIPEVDPTTSINNQFSDIMRRYNTENSMNDIYTADDLGRSMDNQLRELMQQRPQRPANDIPSVAELDELLRESRQMDEIEDYSDIWRNTDVNTKGPRPYAENQGVSPSIENAAEEISKEMDRVDLPENAQELLTSDFEDIYRMMDDMQEAAESTGNPKVMEKFRRLQDSLNDLEKKAFRSDSLEEVNKAKKAADASRQAFTREIKKVRPGYRPELTGTRIGNVEYRRKSVELQKKEAEELANSFIGSEEWLKPENKTSNPIQFFANGKPNDQWKLRQSRLNTFENQGWGNDLPMRDYKYRVLSEAEQHDIAAKRNQTFSDLRHKESFDAPDIKAAMDEVQKQFDDGNSGNAQILARKLAYEGTEHGRGVQAFAEYNRNTFSGALTDAMRTQDDLVVNPWKSRNKKQAEGNSRIAKALADMGNKWKGGKNAPELTHEQIKKGVIAEIEREVGSVENYFNNNDIEFLTQLAEDKSIPVWQITSEIEHKLNTGDWYTLDESLPIPRPTNRRLQDALNYLVNEEIRTEKIPPTLDEIVDQVRNTLGKEAADIEGTFNDNDINYIANLINEGVSKEELANALDLKMATGSWGISDETMQQVNDIFKQISHYDENSKQFVEGQAEAYRLLANELIPDATAMEKFETWRYLAMLGNPKTWIRNYVGNQTFSAVTGISNNIAAIAEAGIDKGIRAFGGEGIQRTKSVLNPISDNALIKACAEDADASRYRQIVGSKYEKMDKSALRQSKSVFNSKLAQFYEKVTDAGISDYKAVKNKFSTSLAGYLKANGYDTDIFKAEDELQRLKNLSKTQLLSDAEKAQMDNLTQEVAALNKARDFALKQAEYATFHEDNELAKFLTKASQDARKSDSTAVNALGLMIEGVVPFKKTPANVLRSGLEYSPLGAIDSIKKTGKLIYENTGKRANNLADVYKTTNILGKEKEVARTLASDVIDSWSKTLTGTGLTALGFYLYNKGILHSSDPDTKYQDQLEGHQNYSIEINGKSYTIDWAAPTVMPLMVGAEAAKLWNTTGKGDEEFYKNIDDYVAAANRIADPLIETSMLSGVKDTLETAASAAQYNENINIPALLAYNTVTGYATQGVPTLAGQVARTIDPTRRSTYTDKEGVAGVLDKQLKKQINKTPGLSMLNQPYVDTYGREQQNSPFNNPIANLGYQMLSPGYLSNINETGADQMSREAYAVNNNESTLPKWQSSFKDSEGNRVSPEEYTKASQAYGNAQYEIRQSLSEDSWYNSLSPEEKEEITSKINTIAGHVGKAAIDPEYSVNNKAYNAYAEGGIPSLKDYFKGEADKSTAKELLGDSGVTTNSKAGKAVVEAVSNGNMNEAKKLAEQAAKDKAAGKTSTSTSSATGSAEDIQKSQFKADFGSNGSRVYKQYEAAKAADPNTSAATFRNTYKRIDSLGDSNGSVNQKEFLQYLTDGNYTEAEAQKLAKTYGSWKTIPKLENGTWKFKKAK